MKVEELESDEEDEIERNPNMNVAFYAHYLSFVDDEDYDIRQKLMDLIQKNGQY